MKFFHFYNFKYQGFTAVQCTLLPIIPYGSGKEIHFVGPAIFSNGGHLDSQSDPIYHSETLESDHVSCEIDNNW